MVSFVLVGEIAWTIWLVEDDCDPVSVKCSPTASVDDLKTLFIDRNKLEVPPGKFFLYLGDVKLNPTDKVGSCLHDESAVSTKPRPTA